MTQFITATFDGFFDRPAVQSALDKKEIKVLKRVGAYTRTIMKNAMKRGAKRDSYREVEVLDSRGRTLYITPQGNVRNDDGHYLPKAAATKIKKKYAPHWRKATNRKAGGADDYPKAWEGTLKRLIRFEYDFAAGAVKVGPLKFNSKQPAGKTIPQLINEGGTVTRRVDGESVRQRYRPRPFVDLTRPKAAAQLVNIYETTPLRS